MSNTPAHGLTAGQHVADGTGRTGVVSYAGSCQYGPCRIPEGRCVEVVWADARHRSTGVAVDAETLTPYDPELVAAITATLEGAR